MLTSCPRCSGPLTLEATMVRCGNCKSLWLSRKDMENEAAAAERKKALADSYFGSGKFVQELNELVLLTQIGAINALFDRIGEVGRELEKFLTENPQSYAEEFMKGQLAGYTELLEWLNMLLRDRADEWDDLTRGEEKKEDE